MGLVEALDQLYKARQYVVQGEKCLCGQRKRVEKLSRQGRDTIGAITLLEILEAMQDEYIEHLERTEKQVMTIVRPED